MKRKIIQGELQLGIMQARKETARKIRTKRIMMVRPLT
jgi:hypothetical protein